MDKTVKEYIKSDYLRYKKDYSKLRIIKEFIINSGFRYSALMRICKAHKINNNKIRYIFFRIIQKLSSNGTIEIFNEGEIGKGLYLGHFSGITINPRAIIGENVNIHKGVTIGQENRGKRKGTPTIGNSVWIGINTTIVGGITIGDNVLIAPNSFVNFNVPSNSVVIGNKVKHCENATDGYIHPPTI